DGKIVSENIFVQSLIDFIYVIDKKFDKMSIFIKEFEKIVKNCKITIEGNLAEAAVTVTLEVKIDENKAFSTENSIFFDFKISFDILDFIKKMLDKFGDKIAD
ncbi:bacteriocin, partial [Clostridium perfringens]